MRIATAALFWTLLIPATAIQTAAQTQAARAADDKISGLYQLVAKMAHVSDDIRAVIEIKSDNGTLSGHVEVGGGNLPITGTYSRGIVTIKFKPGVDLTITAKVEGERITGTWTMDGGRNGAIEMKRVTPGWKQVHDLTIHARQDMVLFMKAGGKTGDTNNPARKWADQLWDYSRQHPGTAEAKDAANEALMLLLGGGLIAEAALRCSTLESADDEWQRAVLNQLASASGEDDHDYAINNADALLQNSKRPALKAQIKIAQGEAWWEKGDPAQAKAIFKRVMDEYPKTRFAEEAKGDIYEIESLNVGQSAPALSSKFVD